MVYTQVGQMKDAKISVNLNAEQLEELRAQVKKSLDEAREAKKDSGFWSGLADVFGSDIGQICMAVAAAAAVVASGGAAAAILAVVAAAATLAADHAKELGIPAEVAVAIAVTASVASLACGNGTALLSVGKTIKDVATVVQVTAQVAGATSQAAGAGCEMEAAKYEQDASYAQAGARSSEGQQVLVCADMDEALERFSEAVDSQSSAVNVTSGVVQRSTAANQAILNNWGGAA